MVDRSNLDKRTLTAQAMGTIDEATGAIVPPVHVSTTYLRDADNSYGKGLVYARADNPTHTHAESLLAALEEGEAACLFASGMAAATAVFQTLRPGDHVLAPRIMYWSLRDWLLNAAQAWGLLVDLVDMSDTGAVEAALRPGVTRLVWLETPANPLWTLSDIAAIAAAAHAVGARVAVDSTVATPVLSRPLALGADLVMHSATKYLNGHSDVIAGALVTAARDEAWQRIVKHRAQGGAVLGPQDAALLLRGMRTLHLRVEAASASALSLAHALERHPGLAEVLYPGLPDHPQHALARGQMPGGFGGMLSIRVKGGAAAAIATAAKVGLWKRATSLGGVESLIEHRASIEGPGTPVPDDLLRLSVGIEAWSDLLADLEAALPSG
ncbi:trans-sulfuration enzyme family protein [Marinivivus vitaminiproducens]|uniref:trans-sulfuration enzyme family protein n=1 Tax=Marinivivus vitaminiproducens TaxID=3035935 RepID=UPI00279F60D0|nr:PLP-dependent aspartate aminotransferase family protein [Geminicoccaceae bacterium SCSIO 64248]